MPLPACLAWQTAGNRALSWTAECPEAAGRTGSSGGSLGRGNKEAKATDVTHVWDYLKALSLSPQSLPPHAHWPESKLVHPDKGEAS